MEGSINKFSADALMVKKLIPELKSSMHKGQSGKIAVVGGSFEYTGAPYYAAISSLKQGVDIAHVFCEKSAGVPIKSYSPELIVHPALDGANEQSSISNVAKWFQGIHGLVVGPGLGRDEPILKIAKGIITRAKEMKLPLVLDGDGLFLLSQDTSIIEGYPYAVLTPNVVEFKRLCDAKNIKENSDPHKQVSELCQSMGGVTIVRKGERDIISNGTFSIECKEEGSLKRSGGQGDVLAGSIGTFLTWANVQNLLDKQLNEVPCSIAAAYGGCLITRMCGRAAFQTHKRSMTTPNVIEQIAPVFDKFEGVLSKY